MAQAVRNLGSNGHMRGVISIITYRATWLAECREAVTAAFADKNRLSCSAGEIFDRFYLRTKTVTLLYEFTHNNKKHTLQYYRH